MRIHFNERRSHYTIRRSCKPQKLPTLYHFPIFPVSSNILNWCVLLVENQFFFGQINLNTASKKHKKNFGAKTYFFYTLYILHPYKQPIEYISKREKLQPRLLCYSQTIAKPFAGALSPKPANRARDAQTAAQYVSSALNESV